MQISNVWKRRLSTFGRGGGRIALAVVVASSAINGLAILWRAAVPADAPPVAAVARSVINETDPVKAFAENCVSGLLTATAAAATDLTRCFPEGRPYTLPTTSSMTVSIPTAWTLSKPHKLPNDITVYSVIVQVVERPYPSAPPTTAFYQLPVAVSEDKAIQALDRIGRADAPPPGAVVPLGYSVKVDAGPVFTMLSGFASALLTNAGGLSRFITTDSGITAINAYTSATLTAAQLDSDPPENPSDNTELAAHIEVSARRPDYSSVPLSYPLTLRCVGGTWFVAQIDAVPVLSDATPTPVPAPAAPAH